MISPYKLNFTGAHVVGANGVELIPEPNKWSVKQYKYKLTVPIYNTCSYNNFTRPPVAWS